MQDYSEFDVIILKINNTEKKFGTEEKIYNVKLCGKSMLEWVIDAMPTKKISFKEINEKSDMEKEIKALLKNGEYTAVFFSDTPLLQKKNVIEIFNYVKIKNLNYCKLHKGFVVRTKDVGENNPNILQASYYLEEDFMQVSSFVEIEKAETILQKRINEAHMRNGIRFVNSETTRIDAGVKLEEGTIIFEGCNLLGRTEIFENCVIGENSKIIDSVISRNSVIENSKVENSFIGENCKIGPFARIRPGCEINNHCKIGNFCEIKNSKILEYTKISHHAYVGDAEIGKKCNIGCGTIFCNYDGKEKHRTKIGNNVFVGSNTNFIAPVEIGDNVVVGAGSTITKNVENNCLTLSRPTQIIKEPKPIK